MLPVGFILKKSYRIQRHIASGGFGNTYEAININNNMVVALKEFFMKGINEYDDKHNVYVTNKDNIQLFNGQKDKFLREAQTLACLNNAHIVRVFDSFNENETAYYVMEFVNGFTLTDIVQRNPGGLDENKAVNILIQILNALLEVHNKNIMHLDIKPANILIQKDGNAKIIDFGASKLKFASNETIATYTPAYAPVELQQQQIDKLGPWTDIYSVGATFYYMITAKKPPLASDIINLGDRAFYWGNNISLKTKSLIKWMMQPAMNNRPANIMQIFHFMETGTGPQLTPNQNNTIVNTDRNSTIYPQSPYNANSFQNYNANNQNGAAYPQKMQQKKKSNGAVWIILSSLILIATIVFFLWKLKVINWGSSGNDNLEPTVLIPDDSEEKTKELKENQLFESLIALCEETKGAFDSVNTEYELDSLMNVFYQKINNTQNLDMYEGINLSDSHQLDFNTEKEYIENLCTQLRNVLKEEERKKEEEIDDNNIFFDEVPEDDEEQILTDDDPLYGDDDSFEQSSDESEFNSGSNDEYYSDDSSY